MLLQAFGNLQNNSFCIALFYFPDCFLQIDVKHKHYCALIHLTFDAALKSVYFLPAGFPAAFLSSALPESFLASPFFASAGAAPASAVAAPSAVVSTFSTSFSSSIFDFLGFVPMDATSVLTSTWTPQGSFGFALIMPGFALSTSF